MTESGSTDMDIPQDAYDAAALSMSSSPGIYYVPQTSHDELYDKLAVLAVDAAFPHLRPLFRHATEVGRELGRREAGEQIAELIGAELDEFGDRPLDYSAGMNRARRIAVDVASFASGASSEPLSGSGVGTGDAEGAK